MAPSLHSVRQTNHMANYYDYLCFYRTQQKTKWWFIRLSIVLVLLAVAVVIIIHFAVIPRVKMSVEDARLDTFEFGTTQSGTATSTLFRYNISVALSIRNSNRAMSVRYTRPLVSTFLFHDRRLDRLTVVDEGHRHRPGKTEVHLLHAAGELPSLLIGTGAAEDYKQQNATGLFMVEMRLSSEIKYQGIVISKKPKLSMSCPLELQLAPPGPEIIEFHEVSCVPVKQDNTYF